MAKYSTSFPQAIALAATWDPELVYRVAKAIAKETRTRGIHQCLSPVVNIVRDGRAGRTEESYGEDPYLTSVMGAMFCKALREEGVIATPKHFVANFVGAGGRDSHEIHFSERILREVYFPGFKACIKAGALSVMAAYNSLDGTPCSSNKWLLTEVLKDEWGFEGFVGSDYGSVAGIMYKHGVAETPEEVAKLAIEAGLDVELPRTEFYGEHLLKAVKEGLVPMEVIDEAVRRVLRAKFLIGLFDKPFTDPDEAERVCNSKEHVQLALEAARKSIVLLKNEGNVLPLDREKIKTIAVIGEPAEELRLGGYSGIPLRGVTPLEGIKSKVKPGTKVYYAKGCSITVGRLYPIPPKYLIPPEGKPGEQGLKGEYFDNPDLSGEPKLIRIDKEINFYWRVRSPAPLIPSENFSIRWTGKLIAPKTRVYQICITADDGVRFWLDGKLLIDSWREGWITRNRVAVKLEAGREYDVKIEYFKRRGLGTIILEWDYEDELIPEVEEAIEIAKRADVTIVFVGIIEGEGRDRATLELPKVQNKMIERLLETGTTVIVVLVTGSAVVGEWIYKVPAIIQAWYPGQEGGTAIAEVLFGEYNPGGKLPFTWPKHAGQLPLYYNYKPSGRGYDYVDMSGKPLFPFGHGLSYTKFKYDNLRVKVNEDEGKVIVSADIENIGDKEGDEVVQLYIHDVVASVARPVKELKGFKRITLKPREKQTVTFTLTLDDLAFYDINMKRVVEPGVFEVLIGSSSEDIRLKGKFKIKREFRAKFEYTNVKRIDKDELTTITLTLKNVGQVSDVVTVKLRLDDREETLSKRLDLSPGESRQVKFQVKKPKHYVLIEIPEARIEFRV